MADPAIELCSGGIDLVARHAPRRATDSFTFENDHSAEATDDHRHIGTPDERGRTALWVSLVVTIVGLVSSPWSTVSSTWELLSGTSCSWRCRLSRRRPPRPGCTIKSSDERGDSSAFRGSVRPLSWAESLSLREFGPFER